MIDPALAQHIVESSTDFAIITLDRQGLITSWNPGAEALLGWSAGEAIGQHARIFFTPEDQAAGSPEDEMQRAVQDGRAIDERFHLKADQSRFWGSGLLMPLNDATGFLKIVRDRTKEREAERRVVTLTDALPGFVYEADPDGHYVQTNARFKEFTGRDDAGLLGDRWLDAVHPDHREQVRAAWAESVAGGEPFDATFLVEGRDGVYRCFACRGIPERDEHGRVLRWIGTCVDVENESKAKAVLEGLNLSLEHAVTDRSDALERSQRTLSAAIAERDRVEDALRQSQKMEAIGQLTGGVAHDFNNLLTVIIGGADMLKRPNLSDEKRSRYIASISATADRAAKLTNQLLAFARRQPLHAESFDIAERLRASEDVLRSVSGSRVLLAFDIRCEPCIVHADPNQFDTAIVNMAINARDAMDGEGEFAIRVEECDRIPAMRGHSAVAGRFVSVAVCDTGSGICDADLPRIFEPFFTTKDVGKGTGLGLSQVFGFAKQSGGDIAIDSQSGLGATFTLYLPCADEPVERDRGAAAFATGQPSAAGSSGGCVLLVEDNQLVGEFAAQLIGELGYVNQWVPSAQEALDVIAAEPDKFDVVFTDVVMPGISGIELAETLRAEHPDMSVILTSGYSHVLALEGSHGFELLQKPYTADGLARVLRATTHAR